MGRLASLQLASFEDRELVASRASRRATVDALHGAMTEATGRVLAALVAQPAALMDLLDLNPARAEGFMCSLTTGSPGRLRAQSQLLSCRCRGKPHVCCI